MRAAQRAIARHGAPEISNTDQGCQVTSAEFPAPLLPRGVKLSMDGKGRCLDNVFVERLWRTVKSEDVRLKRYGSMVDAPAQLDQFFGFYNQRRPHSSLAAATPAETCRATRCVAIKQRPNAPKLKSKVFRAVPRS